MKKLNPSHTDRPQSVSVVSVIEKHEFRPLLFPFMLPVLICHFKPDFHCSRTAVRIKHPGKPFWRYVCNHPGKYCGRLTGQTQESGMADFIYLGLDCIIYFLFPVPVNGYPLYFFK